MIRWAKENITVGDGEPTWMDQLFKKGTHYKSGRHSTLETVNVAKSIFMFQSRHGAYVKVALYWDSHIYNKYTGPLQDYHRDKPGFIYEIYWPGMVNTETGDKVTNMSLKIYYNKSLYDKIMRFINGSCLKLT
jgi:hypothetical protein